MGTRCQTRGTGACGRVRAHRATRRDAARRRRAGNEPDILAPWQFGFAGTPNNTQYWTRWLLQHEYSSAPDGLPGNDDYGTMSAWQVWAYIGLYPVAGAVRRTAWPRQVHSRMLPRRDGAVRAREPVLQRFECHRAGRPGERPARACAQHYVGGVRVRVARDGERRVPAHAVREPFDAVCAVRCARVHYDNGVNRLAGVLDSVSAPRRRVVYEFMNEHIGERRVSQRLAGHLWLTTSLAGPRLLLL